MDDFRAAGAGEAVADAKAELAADFLRTHWRRRVPAHQPAIKRAIETGGPAWRQAPETSSMTCCATAGAHARWTPATSRSANMAATPGQVVFRNESMVTIEYAPQTPKVRTVPMLASPPWINKYYIMDLAPGRSFIEWAVQHERTVFAISYRNPDASMRDVTLDDYLIHGPREPLDVITEITGSPKIDITGLCLGVRLARRQLISPGPAMTGSAPSRCSTPCSTTASRACSEPLPTRRRSPGWSTRWRRRATWRAARWPVLLPPAGQRPHLQLRGVRLADGPGSPGLRPAGLENADSTRVPPWPPCTPSTCARFISATNSPAANWNWPASSSRWVTSRTTPT